MLEILTNISYIMCFYMFMTVVTDKFIRSHKEDILYKDELMIAFGWPIFWAGYIIAYIKSITNKEE